MGTKIVRGCLSCGSTNLDVGPHTALCRDCTDVHHLGEYVELRISASKRFWSGVLAAAVIITAVVVWGMVLRCALQQF